jgi:hypothetical protein
MLVVYIVQDIEYSCVLGLYGDAERLCFVVFVSCSTIPGSLIQSTRVENWQQVFLGVKSLEAMLKSVSVTVM